MNCTACGTDVPIGARFCPSCGNVLASVADQRRVATVLFGDLVGFTALSERRDPEDVKHLVERCFERLAADVVAFGGRVDKVVGDAIVALFGAPVAHEDDPERAVRAALQMQSTLAGMAGDLGEEVGMRIGVNTGEVLVGGIRAGDDYTAMGDVVNTASRLQSAADPGEVLVGAATHAATAGVIVYEDHAAVDAKGKGEPVPVWTAIRPATRPGRRPRTHRASLVGRDAERAILRSTLDLAVSHRRAQVVLLTGEAGVGKSRLAEEVAAEAARLHDAYLLEGQCVPYGEANAWFPIADALQTAAGITSDDSYDEMLAKCRASAASALDLPADAPEVGPIVDTFMFLMGDEQAKQAVDPSRIRDDVVVALHAALAGVARTRPVVVVLSDVHWADERVLELVDRLAERMVHEPLVAVATARTEIDERWRPAAGRFNSIELHLDPLPAAAATCLLAELLGTELPPVVADEVLERSGGNPFFLEELVALLRDHDGELVGSVASTELPATLRGLVAARIDALAPAARATLEDAAVVGRTGPREALGALASERGDFEPTGAVRELVDRDLLVLHGGDYEFKSDLIREVAYSVMTKRDRAARHSTVAEWLERRARQADREDEHLEQLAHHWGTTAELVAELGDVDAIPDDVSMRALKALERAAVRADAQDEPLVVARLLDHVMRLLPPDPQPHRWRALIGRADARESLHQIDEARADIDVALAEAEAAGDAHYTARARTVLGEIVSTSGDCDGAAGILHQAVEEWRQLDDAGGIASALRALGFNDIRRNHLDEADPPIREALELYRRLGSRRGEAWALQNLAWIAFLSGQPDLAEERLNKAAVAFRETGDVGGEGWALGLLAWVRFQQGRLDEAEELAMKVLPRAADRGERWPEAILMVLLAQVALWRGATLDAVARGRQAVDQFTKMDDRYGRIQALTVLSRALIASGSVDEGWAAAEEVDALADDASGMSQFSLGLRASLAAFVGDTERLAPMAEEIAELEQHSDMLIAGERRVTVGLGLLQLGRATDALRVLEAAAGDVSTGGLRAYLAAPLALARMAAGDVVGANEITEELGSQGTYLDHLLATAARSVARAHLDDAVGAVGLSDEAVARADATGDHVAMAVARLARAAAFDLIGRQDDAVASRHDAEERFAAIGIDRTGWERAITAAAHPDARQMVS
ncbi:MAG TPA: adenylate/guanylate cyclase domain-containing protein [Acidimicrobiales bacterium]